MIQAAKKEGVPIDVPGERELLIKAVRVNTLSKLTYSDTRQFLALIGDVFPGAESSDIAGVSGEIRELPWQPGSHLRGEVLQGEGASTTSSSDPQLRLDLLEGITFTMLRAHDTIRVGSCCHPLLVACTSVSSIAIVKVLFLSATVALWSLGDECTVSILSAFLVRRASSSALPASAARLSKPILRCVKLL